MILCHHNGVIRKTSRDRRQVAGLRVKVDHELPGQVIAENKKISKLPEIYIS